MATLNLNFFLFKCLYPEEDKRERKGRWGEGREIYSEETSRPTGKNWVLVLIPGLFKCANMNESTPSQSCGFHAASLSGLLWARMLGKYNGSSSWELPVCSHSGCQTAVRFAWNDGCPRFGHVSHSGGTTSLVTPDELVPTSGGKNGGLSW